MKIGVDVGGSHIGIGLINSNGKIIAKESKDVNNNSKDIKYTETLVNTIIELITKILEKEKTDIKEVKLIGIAIPGTVSYTHIVKAENLHIKNFNIVAEINKYFNIPVSLRNDAKCAALAEKEYGSLKKYSDAVFLTVGTGVGGAVFLGGKLLRPNKYEGFEIGHMVIVKDGIKCNCGREGCFERYASMKVLRDAVEKEYNKKDISGIELEDIIRAELKTEKMQRILDEYIAGLAAGVANLINIFEPETIAIGGSFVYYKDLLVEKLNNKLSEEGMLFNGELPKIVMAELKNDAGIIGATLE